MGASYQTLAAAMLLFHCVSGGANVFGDGNPENGVEDNRLSLNSAVAPGRPSDAWRRSAGTIVCDGQVRGTAMVLDVSDIAGGLTGKFLATAAHVMVDLDSGRPFRACGFHFMGLAHLEDYSARVDPLWVQSGPFDAGAERSDAAFGRGDWAFIYLPRGWRESATVDGVRPAPFPSPVPGAVRDSTLLLVAWDLAARELRVSAGCYARTSEVHDLGGGAWPGQLLDNCDSGLGASGGGLVLVGDSGHLLVGIRSGAHWSPAAYPGSRFPDGPPAGAPWDVRRNTNFARALDSELLLELRKLVERARGAQSHPKDKSP